MMPNHTRHYMQGIALVLLLLATLSVTSSVQAQAWTREQGSYYLSLNYRLIVADQFYGPDFNTVPVADFEQHILGLFAQVGVISRWLTVSLDSELLRHSEIDDQGATTGLGDTRLGFWTGALVEPFHLSVGAIIGFPTGDSSPEASDPNAQPIASILPTGDGEFDVEVRVAAGHGFAPTEKWLEHYVQGSLGFWGRTKGFHQAITYNLELGTRFPWEFIDRFLWILRLNGVESFASNDDARQAQLGLGDGVTYTSLGAEFIVDIWNGFGAGFGVAGAPRGRSIMAAPAYKFSISHTFNP